MERNTCNVLSFIRAGRPGSAAIYSRWTQGYRLAKARSQTAALPSNSASHQKKEENFFAPAGCFTRRKNLYRGDIRRARAQESVESFLSAQQALGREWTFYLSDLTQAEGRGQGSESNGSTLFTRTYVPCYYDTENRMNVRCHLTFQG